jgi:hypothetical protein
MRAAWLCVGSLLLSGAVVAQDKPSRRITSEVVKARGLELQKTLQVDFDGDGKKDLIGVGLSDKGLQLITFNEDAQGAVIKEILPPAGGRELAKFEAKQLVPPLPSNEIWLEVYDDNPDDKVKRVRVYAHHDGKAKEVFSNVLHRPKNAAERPEWERDTSILQYGDPRAGWYAEDLEGDGISEMLVRRKPQMLQLPAGEANAKLITGVREQVFAWDDAAFAYVARNERLVDFLPALPIAKVSASSTWIEPKVLKQMRADALAAALNNDGAADAPAGKDEQKPEPTNKGVKEKGKDSKSKDNASDDVDIDRSAFTARLTDKNLATGWVEDTKGDGKGEWVEVELAEDAPIHMVRVVGGCVDTAASYKAFGIPTKMVIQFDGGSEATVDRREVTKIDAPAVAVTDELVKIPQRPWAKTTLIFFDGKASAKRVRITLNEVAVRNKLNQTCLSEVSVH